MRSILYSTGVIDLESGGTHRWKIKTLHDTISHAERCANYELTMPKYPADGFVIVAEEDPNYVIESFLPGTVSFVPELEAFK